MFTFFKKRKRVKTFTEVMQLINHDRKLRKIMDEFQVEEDDLENIFDILMLCGAGQLVNGYFVAAECLVQPETLRWLLSYYKDNTFSVEDLDHYGSMFFVTDQLINYYIHI